jgi:hypothetical protein
VYSKTHLLDQIRSLKTLSCVRRLFYAMKVCVCVCVCVCVFVCVCKQEKGLLDLLSADSRATPRFGQRKTHRHVRRQTSMRISCAPSNHKAL